MSLTRDEKTEVAYLEQLGSSLDDNIQDSEHDAPLSKREKRLILKQDLLILPLLSGAYLFAYMDRSQIGNARVMGLQKALHLDDNRFFNCLMMFFVGYMIMELPFALALRVIKPSYLYGLSIIAFGVFSVCISAVKSYAPLMVLRLLVGLAEACIQTGFVYVSLWYKPNELASRNGIFFGSAPLASAFTGLISYGVEKNFEGLHGFQSWQWLFIIEGVPTIAWGLLLLFLLPAFPEKVAREGSLFFKNEEERQIMLRRTLVGRNVANAKIETFQIWIALKDVRTWLTCLYLAAPALCVGAFGSFLPTFISEFGFDSLTTQLYTMIPYAFSLLSLAICCWLSDKYNNKWVFVVGSALTSISGFIILLATTNPVALVAGTCFVASGAYVGVVLTATWNVVNQGGYTKRCTVSALGQIFIQCYSIISTQIFTKPPRFFMGHGILLGLSSLGLAAAIANLLIMRNRNLARDRKAEELRRRNETDPNTIKSFEELCDFHPDYRYAL